MTTGSLRDRVEFVVELARRLHAYGSTAQRLESAITAVGSRLGLPVEAWSNPTGLILSFTRPDSPADTDGVERTITRVLRLEPGEVDLGRLSIVDRIAEDVLQQRLDIESGRRAMARLDRPPRPLVRLVQALSFGVAAASVAMMLKTTPPAIATAGVIGIVIGALSVLGSKRPRLADSLDAIAALLATLMATAVAYFVTPIALKPVIVASLIVLMPGLTLTLAVAELASKHWVSGSARTAGAMTTLLKLAFGTVAATQMAKWFGWVPAEPLPWHPPLYYEAIAVVLAGWAFAVLFRARRRDWAIVILSAALGYVVTRLAGSAFGDAAGVFFAGTVIAAAANAYARISNRPGSLVRLPGVILLVPGSVGFRGLAFVFERDVFLGFDSVVTLMTILISLVAGLLFGNLVIAPRSNL